MTSVPNLDSVNGGKGYMGAGRGIGDHGRRILNMVLKWRV